MNASYLMQNLTDGGWATARQEQRWWTEWAQQTATNAISNNYFSYLDGSWTEVVLENAAQWRGEIHVPDRARSAMRERLEAIRARDEAAKLRAEKLLLSVLTATQRAEWLEHRRLTVVGASGRRYRLLPHTVRNVECLKPDGTIHELLCAHPPTDLPIADIILAQKLHLELNEDAFRTIANHSLPWGANLDAIRP